MTGRVDEAYRPVVRAAGVGPSRSGDASRGVGDLTCASWRVGLSLWLRFDPVQYVEGVHDVSAFVLKLTETVAELAAFIRH